MLQIIIKYMQIKITAFDFINDDAQCAAIVAHVLYDISTWNGCSRIYWHEIDF